MNERKRRRISTFKVFTLFAIGVLTINTCSMRQDIRELLKERENNGVITDTTFIDDSGTFSKTMIAEDIKKSTRLIRGYAVDFSEHFKMTATTYNPVVSQCDDTPLITANNTKIDLGKLKRGELKIVALSRDMLTYFPYNSVVYIDELDDFFIVADTMNKRYTRSVDILQAEGTKDFKLHNVKVRKAQLL